MIQIDEAELVKRLGHKNNILRGTVNRGNDAFIMENAQRASDKPKLPKSLFPIVGAMQKLAGTKATAKEFNISEHRAKDIGNARDSTTYTKDTELASKIADVTSRASEIAMNRILRNLNIVDDDDKFTKMSAPDVISATKDISIIVKNITPESKGDGNVHAQVIIMAPQVQPESRYDVMTVETVSQR